MTDAECVALLQWTLPRLRLRWAGYRKVRGQVCKRIRRRMAELGLRDAAAYRARLEATAGEWQVLRSLCVVTISRFYRDRHVWDTLRDEVLPAVAEVAAARGDRIHCWSIGCASGEEAYTLSITWRLALAPRYPGLRLRILGTDVDDAVLRRARRAQYAAASLRDLPARWRAQAFDRHGDLFSLRESFRADVELRRADVLDPAPESRFDLILCRNLVCTYFEEALQRETLGRVLTRLSAGGALVLGRHERLPPGVALRPWRPGLEIFRAPAETPASLVGHRTSPKPS